MSTHDDHHDRRPVDVIVVGAGFIGCAVAREAARAGARVLLVERSAEPSRALHPGLVGAQCDADAPDALFDLRMRGRALLPSLLEALTEETGLRVPRRGAGVLLPARSLAELEVLHARASWQRRSGLVFESITGGTARDREAGLPEDLVAALHLPDETAVDAAALHAALLHACVAAGVELHLATPVLAIARAGGVVTGVHIPEGSVAAGAVVITAGAHSGVGGLPSAPVTPTRSPVVELGQSRSLRHGLWHPQVRITPLPDGRVLLAGAPGGGGFDDRLPAAVLAQLMGAALALAPGLSELPVRRFGMHFGATTPDGRPLLGSTEPVSLLYACGFGEHDITVAPLVASLLVEYLQTGRTTIDLEPFSPLRFHA